VQDVNLGVGGGQLVGELTGAVRAVVVHDEQVGVGHRGPDPGGHRLQVLPLVVGGDDDRHRADRRITAGHAPCSSRWLVADLAERSG
jgi:hypothetical protein